MTQRLVVNFSGGRTSAYMARWLLDHAAADYEMRFVFANTGQEHEKTLEFIRRCDEAWGLGVVWIEAVAHPGERRAPTHRIVTADTASRAGEPFEGVIAKYGIPNRAAPSCSRDLKARPIQSYLRSIGWLGNCWQALGIRIDEIDRMSSDAEKQRLMYPLISMHPTTREDVLTWWSRQPFDLEIPTHYGNCVTCWKKSLRKLMTIAREEPERFDFFRRMEREHGHSGNPKRFSGNGEPMVFFREGNSTEDILRRARTEAFKPFSDQDQFSLLARESIDEAGACSESCEADFDGLVDDDEEAA